MMPIANPNAVTKPRMILMNGSFLGERTAATHACGAATAATLQFRYRIRRNPVTGARVRRPCRFCAPARSPGAGGRYCVSKASTIPLSGDEPSVEDDCLHE